MIDLTATHLALRARALTLTTATTGSTSLSATTSGYARSAGSFVTDGFQIGMEITGAGFSAANNAAHVVIGVTAGLLSVDGGCVAQGVSSGRTVYSRFPEKHALENSGFTPAGRQYVKEEFLPSTSRLISAPSDGGTVEETGLYILTWKGLANKGPLAIRKSVGALMALFAPGTTLTAGSSTVRVRTDTAVTSGQILPDTDGFASCQVVIPWIAYTNNAIAA